MLYQRELSIKYEVDIFVAGGGPAGVAAAVAAARCGKKVFLAEATGSFGGLGTSGMVPAFAPFGDGVNILAAGIGYEIRKNITHDMPLDSYWTTINTEELKREYDKIICDAGVEFSFFTSLLDVICEKDKVKYVVLGSKTGLFAVKAKIYIDATGDGDLCAFGGGEYELGDSDGEVMPATLCSMWTNIDISRVSGRQNRFVEEAFRDGILSQKDKQLTGIFYKSSGNGGGNIGHVFGVQPTDEGSLSAAMVSGRKSMEEYEKYYRKYLSGFEKTELCATACILGVRESRRIKCDYMLNINDFICRASFDDEIGRYCYPVDMHIMNTSEEEFERFEKEYASLRYSKGESYGIPYRSLIPVSFSNVLVAGRCIGTDRKMQASVRVMPGCFITGQAAGTAATLAADSENVRSVNISELKKQLQKAGAYVYCTKD